VKFALTKETFLSMWRFGITSGLATGIDFILFSFVFVNYMNVFSAELLAGGIGMLINFFLQKKYVFKLQRNVYQALALSIGFSLIGLFLGAFLIKGLATISFFAAHLMLAKVLVIGSKFLFNYFTKRWVFEKRGISF
jgi:putative flippase GtrA